MGGRESIGVLAAAAIAAAIGVAWPSAAGALGELQAGERRCFEINSPVDDVALVNLTPVLPASAGDGVLVSSAVTTRPVASNTNYRPGTVDPNVAFTPVGPREQVCYWTSKHTTVHLVADHLGSIARSAFTPATSSGAPNRRADTRNADPIEPGGRLCFSVAGEPGDGAVVNLTPILAAGAGDGKLVSSDVTNPPVSSNVNFRPGSVDPNVAIAPIGADGRVCFVNSPHVAVDLVADHLGSIDAAVYDLPSVTGAPSRRVDTRTAGRKIGPNGRRCFTVAGSPGDAAVVNLTPVLADAAGDGILVSSDVTSPPTGSNVNYAPGTVDPNVAVAPIGADGKVCYVNSRHTSVHLVADHLGTIADAAFTAATASGAPARRIDTRREDANGEHLLDELTVAAQNTSATYDRDDWEHWIDVDGDCQNTRAEVLIRDSSTSVTFASSSACTVATGRWLGPWTGHVFTQASDVDIDHMVPLANAHRSGGWAWTAAKKRNYANDLENIDALRAMDDGSNSSKSDKGPEAWKPPVKSAWCGYATDWSAIKIRWGLTVTQAEYDALATMLDTCDGTITQPPDPPEPPPNCDPSYPTVCIPPPPPDLDCGDIPYRDFTVLQPDPHRFDGNKDGVGCQS